MGSPIPVPRIDQELPSDEQVELLHHLFYSELRRLFEKYKHDHKDGYEKLKLELSPTLPNLSSEEFKQKWSALKPHVVNHEELIAVLKKEDLEKADFAWKESIVTFLFASFSVLGGYKIAGLLGNRN